MKKKVRVLTFALASMILISGCSKSSSTIAPRKDTRFDIKYEIGISEADESQSIKEASKGFVKFFRDNGWKDGINIRFDIQNAKGDQQKTKTIADKFVKDKLDLLFTNGSLSAGSALTATKDIPIIFTSVKDPVGDGLVEALDKPGPNITGTVANDPTGPQLVIDFMTARLGSKKIGVIYNSGNKTSEAEEKAIEEFAAADGASVVKASVATPVEVKQATEALVGKVDSLYVTNDEMIVSAFDSVVTIANDKKIPLFVGDLELLKKGATAASGFDYFDLGYQTAKMALEILGGGKKTTDFPVELPNRLKLVINKKGVANQGLTYDPEWENEAEVIDGE